MASRGDGADSAASQIDVAGSRWARPRLDVIVATNRRSEFLPEALASVEAQAGVDCNLVIVDDGAPDPSYIRSCAANVAGAVVIRQESAGPSAARNRGLLECDSPFVAFLDDDDFWEPAKSIKQINALQEARDAVACGCSGWYVDGSGQHLGSWSPAERRPSRDYLSGAVALPRIVTLIFTRDVCEAVGGFDESFRLGEDLEFTWRVLLRGEFTAVEEKLVHYRQHPGNHSRDGAVRSRDEVARLLVKLIDLCESAGDTETALLFQRQLTRQQSRACVESLRRLKASLGERSTSEAAREGAWLLRHMPWLLHATPAILETLRRS
jgi:glycosyltransferase involved in cell wall biosynthesis